MKQLIIRGLFSSIIPIVVILLFVSQAIRIIDYIIIAILFLIYLFSLIYINKNIKNNVYYILIGVYICISFGHTFVVSHYSKELIKEQSYYSIDKIYINYNNDIKNKLVGITDYNFSNIIEYNNLYNQNIETINKCIYLSNINNGESYVYSFMYNSDKKKNETGSDYFLYNSDSEYIVSNDELIEINNIISSDC